MYLLAFTIVEGFLLFLFTVYYLHRHAHPSCGLPVLFFTFVGWFLGFSILAILPLDILIVK